MKTDAQSIKQLRKIDAQYGERQKKEVPVKPTHQKHRVNYRNMRVQDLAGFQEDDQYDYQDEYGE